MQKGSFRFFAAVSLICSSFFSSVLQSNPIQSGSGLSILAPVTITFSGSYRLSQDIFGTITIAADNVEIDLNNKKITNPSGNGISVTDHYAVTIKNGIIENVLSEGIFINTCSLIEISDIDFIGNNTGLYIETSTSVLVEHCNFVEQTASADPNLSSYAGALVIDNSNNVLVRENEFSNNTNCFGILMQNFSRKNRIENNACNQNQTGIYLNNWCVKNRISGNTCNENSVTNIKRSGSGIYLSNNSSDNVLEDNVCVGNLAISNNLTTSADNGGSGIYLYTNCSENVLRDNICTANSASASSNGQSDNGGSGIYLYWNCSENVLEGNICTANSVSKSTGQSDNGGSGIYLYIFCSKNVLNKNTCSGNSAVGGGVKGGSGIFLYALCNSNTIRENTCDDHSAGPAMTGYGIRINDWDCDNNIICSNNCSHNTDGINDNGSNTDFTSIYANKVLENTTGITSSNSTHVYDNKAVGNGTNYSLSVIPAAKIRVETDAITTGSWGDNFAGA